MCGIDGLQSTVLLRSIRRQSSIFSENKHDTRTTWRKQSSYQSINQSITVECIMNHRIAKNLKYPKKSQSINQLTEAKHLASAKVHINQLVNQSIKQSTDTRYLRLAKNESVNRSIDWNSVVCVTTHKINQSINRSDTWVITHPYEPYRYIPFNQVMSPLFNSYCLSAGHGSDLCDMAEKKNTASRRPRNFNAQFPIGQAAFGKNYASLFEEIALNPPCNLSLSFCSFPVQV